MVIAAVPIWYVGKGEEAERKSYGLAKRSALGPSFAGVGGQRQSLLSVVAVQ
jgi:hypothetical protein